LRIFSVIVENFLCSVAVDFEPCYNIAVSSIVNGGEDIIL